MRRNDEKPAGRRVLVVEDDPDTAVTMATLLELWGYEPEVVRDGWAALAAVQRRAPDAVLLDLGLPGLDGYEVARRLRRRLPGALLIALSGYAQPLDRIATAHAGCDLHLAKPADPEEVRAALPCRR